MIATRNPLAYDKKTGLYQKVNKPHDVPLKRTYASFLMSTCGSLDVSEVYTPVKKACMSFVTVPLQNIDIKNFENIIPTPMVRYIIGQEFDYIKKF
jgi:hypothetical protein